MRPGQWRRRSSAQSERTQRSTEGMRRVVRAGVPSTRRSHDARKNYEHYLALARNEAASGNTVAAENYYQHAEHYYRSMMANLD
jgi:hypothetical protein